MDTNILPDYVTYNYVLTFAIGAVLFAIVGTAAAWVLRPTDPYPAKRSTYECAEPPFGNAWMRFNVRYYYFAILFLLFDVEIIFFFPWAVAFRLLKPEYVLLHTPAALMAQGGFDRYGVWAAQNFGFAIFGEMLFFIFMLLVGWVFAWKKGFLRWD
jgi:NADH:ubiquinone oxidoreductase subunit 3 (subunit A)